jgi:hypothetical protein
MEGLTEGASAGFGGRLRRLSREKCGDFGVSPGPHGELAQILQ